MYYKLLKQIQQIKARLVGLESRGPSVLVAAAQSITAGTGNPNGVVSATGVAIYIDKTDPANPEMYLKTSAGTSNNEWV